MITASQLRDKAVFAIIFLLLYAVLGTYLLFKKPDPISIDHSGNFHESQSMVFDLKKIG